MGFVITKKWVWGNYTRPDLFARRFIRSATMDWKVKWSRDYSIMMMKKLAITEDEDEAIADATMSFIVDTMSNWVSKQFPTERKASNYLHGAFRYWFFNKVRDTPETRAKTLPIESLTQGVIMEDTTQKLDAISELKAAVEFAEKAGPRTSFILSYIMMEKCDQGHFWTKDRSQFRFPNGETLSKMTFYNRVKDVKASLAAYLRGEDDAMRPVVQDKSGLVPVADFPNYFISPEGHVFAFKPSGKKQLRVSKKGQVTLSKGGRSFSRSVNRLRQAAYPEKKVS